MTSKPPIWLIRACWGLFFIWLFANADAWGGYVWEKAAHPEAWFGAYFGDQDSEQYFAWVENGPSFARSPYRYRVLAPWLAGWLPGTPWQGLMIISWSSLAGFLVICLRTGYQMGYTWEAHLATLLASTGWAFLYLYLQPFLTDALALALLAASILAVRNHRFWLFVLFISLAVLTREVMFPFALLWWFHREKGKTGLAIIMAGIMLFLPRILLPEDILEPGILEVIRNSWQVSPIFWRLKEIYSVLGPCWWLLPLAWKAVPPSERSFTAHLLGISLLTAMLASVIATDTGRMFTLILPGFVLVMLNLIRQSIQHWPIWLILAAGRAASLWSALHPYPRGLSLHPWLDILLAGIAIGFLWVYWPKVNGRIQT